MKSITALLTILYIHIGYIAFGLDREYFYITRANCFADLKLFNYAIGNYRRALQESEDPKVTAALGWCYSQTNQIKLSLKYYRMAYKKVPGDPDIALGIAYVEFYNNNIREATAVIKRMLRDNTADSTHLDDIKRLEEMIQEQQSEKEDSPNRPNS